MKERQVMRNKLMITAFGIVVIAAVLFYFLFPEKESGIPSGMQAYPLAFNEQCAKAAEPSITTPEQTLWYKNGLMDTPDMAVFKDSDGDGYGDFKGRTAKLDYIKLPGTTIIWLAPFQPTPNGDGDYDSSNFYHVDPHVGTMADYRQFVEPAAQQGIQAMMNFVFNHRAAVRRFPSSRKPTGTPGTG